jgi:hypothetical protein
MPVRRTAWLVWVVAAPVGACGSGAGRGEPPGTPAALLARAIEQRGGAAAVAGARTLTWEGDAVIHAGGRLVNITGTWQVHAPDSAIVATWEVMRGPSTMRALVLASPRGWIVSGKAFSPMPEGMLESERDEFYLYDVMRLGSLSDSGVTLVRVEPDTVGQAGFRVERAGRPPVELYVDGAGALAHLVLPVRNPAGGAPSRQDVWLSGVVEDAGFRWPREIRLTMDGAPYFTLTLRSLRVQDRLSDARFAGPPAG